MDFSADRDGLADQDRACRLLRTLRIAQADANGGIIGERRAALDRTDLYDLEPADGAVAAWIEPHQRHVRQHGVVGDGAGIEVGAQQVLLEARTAGCTEKQQAGNRHAARGLLQDADY
jgi:hypothetical protein